MFVIGDRRGFSEQVKDPRYERIQILRTATGAQIAVSNEFLVEPRCTGIHDVVPNAGPTRQSSPFEQAGRREHPRVNIRACPPSSSALGNNHRNVIVLLLPAEPLNVVDD